MRASAFRQLAPRATQCAVSRGVHSGKPAWDGSRTAKEYPMHVKTIASLSKDQVLKVLSVAADMKATPQKYLQLLRQRTLLMLFEKPSLRTRVSFETGMTQLGGHAIYYNIADSPLGKKESIQMLADLLTIAEVRKTTNFSGMKLAFVGDCQNNMTYDLMRLACLMGFNIHVAGPDSKDFEVEWTVVKECEAMLQKTSGGSFKIGHDRDAAIKDADVVYCDSWMSYGIPPADRAERLKALMPFQVTGKTMDLAAKDSIFMNCLPAMRGEEQTAEVIDGPKSVVWDQAENRLHAQKALLSLLILGFDSKLLH